MTTVGATSQGWLQRKWVQIVSPQGREAPELCEGILRREGTGCSGSPRGVLLPHPSCRGSPWAPDLGLPDQPDAFSEPQPRRSRASGMTPPEPVTRAPCKVPVSRAVGPGPKPHPGGEWTAGGRLESAARRPGEKAYLEMGCIFLDVSLLFRDAWIWSTRQSWVGHSPPRGRARARKSPGHWSSPGVCVLAGVRHPGTALGQTHEGSRKAGKESHYATPDDSGPWCFQGDLKGRVSPPPSDAEGGPIRV